MEGKDGAEILLQSMEETHVGAGECLKEGFEPMRSLCWIRLLAGTCRPMERGDHAGGHFLVELATMWETHDGAGCAGRTAPHGRVTQVGAVLGELGGGRAWEEGRSVANMFLRFISSLIIFFTN